MDEIKFANRIAGMETSIFSTMSRLAVEYKAVNLGQGFPDFDGPLWLMEEAFRAMKSGKNQYAPMNGILTLRRIIAENLKKFYDLEFNPDSDITITAGATEALFSSIMALINPGDEVILFEPFYDSYLGDVQVAGGIPVMVTLHKPDFTYDFDELEKAVTTKTKMIIVNNPHNPTGKVYNRSELEKIAHLAVKNNLIVISDEVYEHLTYDNIEHIPIASLPEMSDRTITISSTGKTFSMTGWKIGWAAAPSRINEAIQKIHQWTTFAVNTPGQHAMAYALAQLESYLPEFRKEYQKRRDLIYSLLLETQFTPHKPDGSYFIMADLPENIGLDDLACAIELVKKFGVATIPPSVFYLNSSEGSSMLRLCFAKQNETIIEGIERMKKFDL